MVGRARREVLETERGSRFVAASAYARDSGRGSVVVRFGPDLESVGGGQVTGVPVPKIVAVVCVTAAAPPLTAVSGGAGGVVNVPSGPSAVPPSITGLPASCLTSCALSATNRKW